MFDGSEDSVFYQEPDYLLTDLVSLMVNRTGMQLGVTLLVNGAVITGTLVSERDYLDALSEAFLIQARRSMPSPSKEDLESLKNLFDFKGLAEDTYPDEDADEDEADEPEYELTPIRYLHLKDPTILLPHPSLSFSQGDISIVRIRLTAVDGWLLGRSTVFLTDDEDDNSPEILH